MGGVIREYRKVVQKVRIQGASSAEGLTYIIVPARATESRLRVPYIHPLINSGWLAQPRLHGLFVGEVLVFLLFKGKLIKHANHRN